MKTRIISIYDKNAIETAKTHLKDGDVIAFPTDTIYGVGVSAFNQDAIETLYEVKKRDQTKPIPVLVGNENQLKLLSKNLSNTASILVKKFWPGALTIIVSKKGSLPKILSSDETIGIRSPDHSFTLELLNSTGPLAVTSANLSGGQNPISAKDVMEQLGGRIALILDGGEMRNNVPSTVIDCTCDPPNILREGSIPAKDINEILSLI